MHSNHIVQVGQGLLGPALSFLPLLYTQGLDRPVPPAEDQPSGLAQRTLDMQILRKPSAPMFPTWISRV